MRRRVGSCRARVRLRTRISMVGSKTLRGRSIRVTLIMCGVLAFSGALFDGAVSFAGPGKPPHVRSLPHLSRHLPSRLERILVSARLSHDRALRSPAARRLRRRSRVAFHGMSGAGALRLLEQVFPFATAQRPWGGLATRLPSRWHIVRYVGRYSAQVRVGSGKSSHVELVESLTPLGGEPAAVVKTANAARFAPRAAADRPAPGSLPVDLTLRSQGPYFVPAVSGTPVEIPTDAGSDLVFPGQGITVHVVGAAPAAGQLLHGERVAYGSALTDTDLLITPQDVGAEYSWQARSSDSPQT
jgi:hypothetical protein